MQRFFAHWNSQGAQELLLQSASSDPSIQSLSPSHFHAAGKQYRFTSYQSIALCPIVELTRDARTRNSERIHFRIRISDALIRQLFLFESEIAFVVIAATFTIGHRRRSDGTYNQNIEVSWNRCTQNSFYFCRLAIGMGHSSLIAELVTQKARPLRQTATGRPQFVIFIFSFVFCYFPPQNNVIFRSLHNDRNQEKILRKAALRSTVTIIHWWLPDVYPNIVKT